MGACAEKTPCLPLGSFPSGGELESSQTPHFTLLTAPPAPRTPRPPPQGRAWQGPSPAGPRLYSSGPWLLPSSSDSSISHCPEVVCSVNRLPALTGSLEPGERGQVDKGCTREAEGLGLSSLLGEDRVLPAPMASVPQKKENIVQGEDHPGCLQRGLLGPPASGRREQGRLCVPGHSLC